MVRSTTFSVLMVSATAFLLGGCGPAPTGPTGSPGPTAFKTPDAAVDSLVTALRANDQKQLHAILGPDADDLLSSGDEVADASGRAEFLKLYDEKHRLEAAAADSMTLDVGATDWPLPIPIVKGADGWTFDTNAGLDEMLSRRIGKNELATIQVCLAIVDAEKEYAAADYAGNGWLEYAAKFRSDEGKKNGLYWPAAEGEPDSPLGDLIATATSEGYSYDAANDGPRPYHGYYYRILTAQGPAAPGGELSFLAQGHLIGGFGVVAWPADYGNSGIKTFITSHHGEVFEKDLGEGTEAAAKAMTTFDPDGTWQKSPTEPTEP